MELDGFSHAIVGILGHDEQVVTKSVDTDKALSDSGLFRIDADSSLGVLNASISGLAPQTQTISGSNKVVAISGAGTGQITLTLGVNDLPAEVEYRLIGARQDDNGAWVQSNTTRSPFAAVELTAENREGDGDDNGKTAAHIALLKGQFNIQPQNLRTDNGTGSVNRATDSLQFKAINRSNGDVIKYGFENSDSFHLDNFRKDVFPGADIDAVSDAINKQDDNKGNDDHKVAPSNNPVHNK